MKTSSVRIIFAALTLSAFISCTSDHIKKNENINDDRFSSNETETTSNSSISDDEPENMEHTDTIADSPWNINKLDTARNVKYMSSKEKDIILEMNMARSNPGLYAELYLEPYKEFLTSDETVQSVDECIETMKLTGTMKMLKPSEGLSRCAQKHAASQSSSGVTGHTRINGASFRNDVKKYVNYRILGECVLYGVDSVRDIVIQLLIDDGVSGRGHRENLLNPSFEFAGCGFTDNHSEYKFECVIDYGGTK